MGGGLNDNNAKLNSVNVVVKVGVELGKNLKEKMLLKKYYLPHLQTFSLHFYMKT